MSVHSTEVIIAEAERIRSIIFGVKAVPRFSDIHGIYQTSKFELSELEDNNQNRIDTLNKIISNSINMISKEYIDSISSEQIKLIKGEFQKNKKFVVSQKFIGTRGSDVIENSYENQLRNFPMLAEAIDKISNSLEKEKDDFVNRIKKNEIELNGLLFSDYRDLEYKSSIIELVLEGLRNLDNPILDRKEKDIYEYKT
jgi:hypothetical protein